MSLQTVFLVGGYKKEKSIPLDSGSWGPLLWVPRREKRNTQFDTCRERKNNTRSGGIEGKGGKEGDGRVSIKMQSSVRTPPSYCCRSFPTLQAKKRKKGSFSNHRFGGPRRWCLNFWRRRRRRKSGWWALINLSASSSRSLPPRMEWREEVRKRKKSHRHNLLFRTNIESNYIPKV